MNLQILYVWLDHMSINHILIVVSGIMQGHLFLQMYQAMVDTNPRPGEASQMSRSSIKQGKSCWKVVPILLGSTHWCCSYRIKACIIVLATFICTAVLPTVELLCLKTSYSQLHRFSGLILRCKFVGRVLALTIGGSRSTCKLKFGQENGWHFLVQVGNEEWIPVTNHVRLKEYTVGSLVGSTPRLQALFVHASQRAAKR